MLLSRRMIVAVYERRNTLWATVVPVASTMSFGGFSNPQKEAKKPHDETDTFATFLVSAENALDAQKSVSLRRNDMELYNAIFT